MTDAMMIPRSAGHAVRWTGAMLVAAVLAFALLGPLAVPGDPFAQSLLKALAGPESGAPLGYDHLGRSIFHRLVRPPLRSPRC